MNSNHIETAILANGCFWCTEAIFQKINGVLEVSPGYIGGKTENPTYKEVCTGTTDHAEALKIVFDNSLISFEELLEVYFATHDPTSLNRQGNDIGTQYRSEIFYTNERQKEISEAYISSLKEEKVFEKPIVTKLSKASIFYPAEDYHFDYFNNHPENSYCAVVVDPKIRKFEKVFQKYLRK